MGSLMSLLRGQLLNVLLLHNQIHIFFVKKMGEKLLQCKSFSDFFQQKNIDLFQILTFEIITKH